MGEEDNISIIQLIDQYQTSKNQNLLDELAKRLMPAVRKTVDKLIRDRNQYEDLIQLASIGMLKAINNYDYNKNDNFYGYLIPMMVGEIKHYYRDQGWVVNVPRNLKKLSALIYQTTPNLAQKLQRMPTIKDLSMELGVSREKILEAINCQYIYNVASINEGIYYSEGNGNITLEQVLGEQDINIERIDDQSELAEIFSKLTQKEKKLLILRFVDKLTQEKIADILDISQMQVSRAIKELSYKLKRVKEQIDENIY